MFYAYIVECSNGTLYTGWTTDVPQRLKKHNCGKGAKYTRANLPVTLKACWEFGSKAEAMRFEWRVKRLSREAKLELIQRNAVDFKAFQDSATNNL